MVSEHFDPKLHRANKNYSMSVLVKRVVWGLVLPLFVYSPRFCYAWRVFLLRVFGAKIGEGVRIYPSANVFFPWNLEVGDHSAVSWNTLLYSIGKIRIGSGVLISHGAHICAGTHDYTQPSMPLLAKDVVIGDRVWVCADAFIGPGCRVGDDAVVGARAVVICDVGDGAVVAGNPARMVRDRYSSHVEHLEG